MPENDKTHADTGQAAVQDNHKVRVGVYTCYCGGNISDVVNCEKVAKAMSRLSDVVISRTNMSMCSNAGQALIEEDIKEKGVNRVVIGACAPMLHEQTFRKTVERAGLNPYLYYHVGIREQDSWVHHDDKEGATDKAIRLMSAGVAKARYLEPLDPIVLEANQHALVIGGGIAGLRSALDIARQGIQVTLIEKSPFLGGRMAQLESVFPTEENSRDLLHRLIEKVLVHPNITIFTRAQLTEANGYLGDYRVTIKILPRGIQDEFSDFEEAASVCPIEVPDEFNYGLTTRKAIYKAYPGCYPATPAIDWETCSRCEECLKVDSKNINLDNKAMQIELNVGAVVVATGFKPYEPRHGEYGYGEYKEVVTLPKLIRLLALNDGDAELTWNGRAVKNMVVVHCVGSRQIPGVNEPQPDGQLNEYCSRVCCTAALHTLKELRERYPDLNIFDVYEDIRTYGWGHEEYYTQASKDMVTFLRFHGDQPAELHESPNGDVDPLLLKVKDHLTWGEEIEIPVDLVVLATGMMPNVIDDLIKMLKVSPGTDRFLAEVHPKLRPVETAVPGVILAGTAQGPMNITESIAAASAAAAKVAVLLGQGKVDLEPFVAKVDLDKCNGTGLCVEVCGYEDAISLEPVSVNGGQEKRAVVTPANCTGCGACVSACPNGAIDVQGWTIKQYTAMIEALTADTPVLEVAS